MARCTIFGFLGAVFWINTVCAQSTSTTGAGLQGEYYADWAFRKKVVTRIDRQIDFSWDGYGAPAPGVPPQRFSVRWTGKLYAPTTGDYRFTAVVDDGIRILVNGIVAMDEWQDQHRKLQGRAIRLEGGRFYDLKIFYYNAANGGYVQLNWNLVTETGKPGTFLKTPDNKISSQFLYSPTAPTPVPKEKPQLVKSLPPPVKVTPVAVVKPKPVPKPVKVSRAAPVAEPAVATVEKPRTPLPPANPFDHLKEGDTVRLGQLLFDQSQYVLRPESELELSKLATSLLKSPTLHLLIAGHTDNVGDQRLNQLLSENRATVIANYLIRSGVARYRVAAKGYGGARPLTDNTTEVEKQKNRRVEIIVVKN